MVKIKKDSPVVSLRPLQVLYKSYIPFNCHAKGNVLNVVPFLYTKVYGSYTLTDRGCRFGFAKVFTPGLQCLNLSMFLQ